MPTACNAFAISGLGKRQFHFFRSKLIVDLGPRKAQGEYTLGSRF